MKKNSTNMQVLSTKCSFLSMNEVHAVDKKRGIPRNTSV